MILFALAGFILGTILGSFSKALADRSLKNTTFLGRSKCPDCQQILKWYDLVPILSYLYLAGRCRYCHKKINLEYPIIELASGILIAYLFWSFSGMPWGELIFQTFFITTLVILFLTDLKKMLIPDRIILPALVISLIFQPPILAILLGLSIALFFLILIIITRGKGMGGGDVKLGAFIGLGLGFPNGLLAIILAFFTGAVWAIILIILKKKHFGENLPFGPFLVLGSLISLFWGEKIISWYLKLGS